MSIIPKFKKKHPVSPKVYWTLNAALFMGFVWTFGRLVRWW